MTYSINGHIEVEQGSDEEAEVITNLREVVEDLPGVNAAHYSNGATQVNLLEPQSEGS